MSDTKKRTPTFSMLPKTKEEFIAGAAAETPTPSPTVDNSHNSEIVKKIIRTKAKSDKLSNDKRIKSKNEKMTIERKVVLLTPDLAKAFLDYQYEHRSAGEKVSFQSLVVGLLRTTFKKYL